MSDKNKKYISDHRAQKNEDFTKIYEGLDADTLGLILDSQPELINKRDDKTGLTLLFRAVMNENYEISEFLLEKNADPNVQNVFGETALHNAVENSNHKLINLLLEKGADPNIQQMDGETAMHIAALQGDYKVIKLLHLYGADPNISTFECKYKPFDYAQKRGDQKSIKVLISIMDKVISDNSPENNPAINRTGLQTAKNSEFPLDRMKNNVNLQIDYPLFGKPYSNTAKNSQADYHRRNISQIYPHSSNDLNQRSLNELNIGHNYIYPNSDALRKERRNSYNLNSHNNNTVDTITNHHVTSPQNYKIEDTETNQNLLSKESNFLDQMSVFEKRLEKIKKGLMENLVSNSDINLNTNSDNPIPTVNNFNDNNNDVYFTHNDGHHVNYTQQEEQEHEEHYNNEEHYNPEMHYNEHNFTDMNNEYGSNVTPYLRSNSLNSTANNNLISPSNNSFYNYNSNSSRLRNKFHVSKKYGYDSSSLPLNLNYENLINSYNNKKHQISNSMHNISLHNPSSHPISNTVLINDPSHFNDSLEYNNNNIMKNNPEYELTLRKNIYDLHNTQNEMQNAEQIHPYENEEEIQSSRITYLTDRLMSGRKNNDEVYNLPLKRDIKQSNLYSEENSSFNNSKMTKLINVSDLHFKPMPQPVEPFEDTNNKVLAVFFSSKNDIDENYTKTESSTPIKEMMSMKLKKSCESSYKKQMSDINKYSELFNFNIQEMNDFIKNTENDEDDDFEEDDEEDEEEDKQLDNFVGQIEPENIKNFQMTTGTFYSRKFTFNNMNEQIKKNSINQKPDNNNKNIPNNNSDFIYDSMNPNVNTSNMKYFSKIQENSKDEFKQISLDTNNNEMSININSNMIETDKNIMSNETLDKMNVHFDNFNKKKSTGLIELEYYSTEAIKEINAFLKSLDLDFYTPYFIKNGFDDLKLVVDQMKSDMAITDQNLRDIGINIPGHRAKILIRLEEECNNFGFILPPNVYYTIPDDLKNNIDIESDYNVNSLHKWLANLKMEQFLYNFLNAGYHSIELLFMQMNSKNIITEAILDEEIGINKIGHRIRILNKLRDDALSYITKLKARKVNIKKENHPESCSRCIIF